MYSHYGLNKTLICVSTTSRDALFLLKSAQPITGLMHDTVMDNNYVFSFFTTYDVSDLFTIILFHLQRFLFYFKFLDQIIKSVHISTSLPQIYINILLYYQK